MFNHFSFPSLSIFAVILLWCCAAFAQTAQAHSNLTILGIELSPAYCQLKFGNKKLRQCIEGKVMSVNYFDTGLKGECSTEHILKLSPVQESVVSKLVPDRVIREMLWRNYGMCSGLKSSEYFRQLTNLSNKLQLPKQLMNGNSYRVARHEFLSQIADLNRGLEVDDINLYCQVNASKQVILTHINICFDRNHHFAQCQNLKKQTCPSYFYLDGYH